jgi:CubicO group peptidase (beta-lactamase class C family)
VRLGILYLNDGMWGTERILDSEWIKYSSTPSEVSRGFYASQFWIPRLSGLQGSYQAVGWRVQRIFIFPAKKLVILRLGCTEGLPWNEGSFYREVISLLPTTDQPDQQ